MTHLYVRSRLAASLVLLSGALAACDNSAPVIGPSVDPELARKVAELGFDPSSVVDRGDRVVVEGDIILLKSDLQAPRRTQVPSRPRFQYAGTNRVIASYSQIYVDYSAVGSQSSAWQTAVYEALGKWNSVPGGNVYLSNSPGSAYATITVAFGQCEGDSSVIACAMFPRADGTPGPNIVIDSDYKNQLTSSEKLFTMVHELGHTLGFRHTNWNNRTCRNAFGQTYVCAEPVDTVGAQHIPGTPTSTTGGPQSDPSSIMNATVLPWSGFTYYDRVATRYLFPGGPGPYPTGSISAGRAKLTWTAMQDAVSYDVYYVYSDWQPFWHNTYRTYMGQTTATTYTDNTRSYSSVSDPMGCGIANHNYVVRANFSDGSQSGDSYMACFY